MNLFRIRWVYFRQHRLALVGAGIVVALLVVALLAPIIAPRNPIEQDLYNRLRSPDLSYPLGTDDFGRDILSRIIYGSRISLRIGLISISIALLAGSTILAFPSILLAIAIVAVIGPGIENVMIAVSIVMVPQFARLVRASALSIRELPYIEATRALGSGEFRLMFRGVLPNCLAPLIVQATLSLGTAMLDAAGLSFLGLGAQPPTPEWGSMLSNGRELLLKAPWVMAFPGMAIFVVVLGLNFLGDGLRDVLDPRGLIPQKQT